MSCLIMSSKTYSIYEARAKLSELVRMTLSHGSVLITQRGKPVIRLVPYVAASNSPSSRLRELEHIGRAKQATAQWTDALASVPHANVPEGALDRFLADRNAPDDET